MMCCRRCFQADAAALIAFTNYDLYPGETWHFVFGQATFSERVGVYSLYRLSDIASERNNDADRLLDPHAEDRYARDRPYVLDEALHKVRMPYVGHEQSWTKRTGGRWIIARNVWQSLPGR